jgi:hypothetical protein
MGLGCTVYNYRNKSVMPEPNGIGVDAVWGGGPFPLEEDPVWHERERIDYLFRVRNWTQANIRGILVQAENIR